MGFSNDQNSNFGDGSVGGDLSLTAPVNGNVKESGSDVTFSQGNNNNYQGHTLIADGHGQKADRFYERAPDRRSVGHAHFDDKGNEIHGSPRYGG